MKTRKFVVVAAVVLLVGWLGVKASKAAPPPIPPEVAAENWRPITDDVGIALQSRRGANRQAPLFGTLMVRERDRWRIVELMPGSPRAIPAQ